MDILDDLKGSHVNKVPAVRPLLLKLKQDETESSGIVSGSSTSLGSSVPDLEKLFTEERNYRVRESFHYDKLILTAFLYRIPTKSLTRRRLVFVPTF
jgi:hypothetical protein